MDNSKMNTTYLNGDPYYGEGVGANIKSNLAKINVRGIAITASTAFLGMCALGATFSLANIGAIIVRPEFQLLSADTIPWVVGAGMSIKGFKSTKEFLDNVKNSSSKQQINEANITR